MNTNQFSKKMKTYTALGLVGVFSLLSLESSAQEFSKPLTAIERSEKMQNFSATGERGGQFHKKKSGPGMFRFMSNTGVTVASQLSDTALTLDLSTTDAEILTEIHAMVDMMEERQQAREARENSEEDTSENNSEKPENAPKKIEHSSEKTTNGARITFTSEDAEVLTHMADRLEMQKLKKKIKASGVDIRESITREVINTENGVQVLISSENADVQKFIQLREKNAGKKGFGKGFGNSMGKGKGGFHGGGHKRGHGKFKSGEQGESNIGQGGEHGEHTRSGRRGMRGGENRDSE